MFFPFFSFAYHGHTHTYSLLSWDQGSNNFLLHGWMYRCVTTRLLCCASVCGNELVVKKLTVIWCGSNEATNHLNHIRTTSLLPSSPLVPHSPPLFILFLPSTPSPVPLSRGQKMGPSSGSDGPSSTVESVICPRGRNGSAEGESVGEEEGEGVI